MLRKTLWAVLVLLLVTSGAFAQKLEIVEAVITTNIVDRVPVDSLESYSATVDKLYCFVRVVGAEQDTTIAHVWYHGDQEVARVTLPVRSSHWRTWSSKNILPEWTGEWRVEVVDAEGYILSTVSFSLF